MPIELGPLRFGIGQERSLGKLAPLAKLKARVNLERRNLPLSSNYRAPKYPDIFGVAYGSCEARNRG
jgi:hypothetical protein